MLLFAEFQCLNYISHAVNMPDRWTEDTAKLHLADLREGEAAARMVLLRGSPRGLGVLFRVILRATGR